MLRGVPCGWYWRVVFCGCAFGWGWVLFRIAAAGRADCGGVVQVQSLRYS